MNFARFILFINECHILTRVRLLVSVSLISMSSPPVSSCYNNCVALYFFPFIIKFLVLFWKIDLRNISSSHHRISIKAKQDPGKVNYLRNEIENIRTVKLLKNSEACEITCHVRDSDWAHLSMSVLLNV